MQSNTNNIKPDSNVVNSFLGGRMAAVDTGYMVIFCVKGEVRRSRFFGPGDGDKAALYVADMAQKGWDVYFGQGFLKKPLQSPSRGKETDVEIILGVWFDGDIKGGIHKENPDNLPTVEELEAFLNDEIPFKASQIIASSPDGGRHLHWLFSEPFIIQSENDRQFIKALSESFQKVIKKKMKAHGWKQDNTSDLVRVLRIPGTFNFKGDPVPVSMVSDTGFRYTAYSILEWVDMEEEAQQEAHEGGSSDGNHTHGDLEKSIQACEFLRHWRDHSADLTEPEWWAGICAIHTEPGAEKAIHEYSKTYPDYTPKETNKKIKEAQKLTGPMSCKAIRDKTGFEGCPGGGCGVAYPIHLGSDPVQWESPILLDDYTVPAFDVRLPGILGEMCEAVSKATETPLELAVGDCLAAVATAVHGKIIVRVKTGYTEPLNVWIATFLEPGNRKTAVLILTTKPLITWEAAKREQEKPRIQQIESERKSQDARIKRLRAQYGKAEFEELEEIQHEILKIENEMTPIPVYPKVWVDDVTPEHFGTLLGRHDGCMAIISSEGGIIEIIAGRYNGGIPNLDVFLKSHAGDPVRVDRGSRDPVDIERPASTFGLSPQPDVLKGMAEKKGFRGRGLLGRFLYFLPKSNLGHRTLETEPITEPISNKWEGLIHTLLDIEPQKNDADQVEPFVIDLRPAAYSEWFEFQKMVEPEMAEGGRFESMKDWAGKLPGAAARLAGLLHCVKHPQQPWGEKISVETMGTALDIAAVASSHAEVAFDLMGADVAIEGAKKVWRWVEKGRHESFTKRDCFQALRGTFSRVSDLEPPLDVLDERNYIAGATVKGGPQGGRPSIAYSVNPEIIKGWM
jgi:hypothetical protein